MIKRGIRCVEFILFCLLPFSTFADLFVLRSGSGLSYPAVLRYNEETGAFIDRFDPSTNGFRIGETEDGMCFGPDGNLYTTGNSLGDGQINCFDGVSGQLIRILHTTNVEAPSGLRFGNSGQLYVCGYSNVHISPAIPTLFVLNPTNGTIIQRFRMPDDLSDVVINKAGLVLVSSPTRGVLRANASVFANVDWPEALTFGPDGHLYVSSWRSNSVLKFDGTNGTMLSTFVAPGSGGLAGPTGLTFDPDGHLYVACSASNSIFRYNGTNGAFLGQFVAPGSGGLDRSVKMIEFAPIPRLRAWRAQTNIVIAWPAGLTTFNLESTVAVSSSNSWTAVTGNMGIVGRERVMTNTSSGNVFYRLRKQ